MKGVILSKIEECTTIIILIILFTIQNYFKQVMTIADLRSLVIVEKQHVHYFDFGLWPKVSYYKVWRTSLQRLNLSKWVKRVKTFRYAISSRSDTPISIKCFLKKSSEIFLSVEPGWPTAGEKNKKSSNMTFFVITLRIGPFWNIFKKFSQYKFFWIIH